MLYLPAGLHIAQLRHLVLHHLPALAVKVHTTTALASVEVQLTGQGHKRALQHQALPCCVPVPIERGRERKTERERDRETDKADDG